LQKKQLTRAGYGPKASHQLHAAEDRIAELEAEVTAYQERVDRAEQSLHRVYTEIEDRFLQQKSSRCGTSGVPPTRDVKIARVH
jgi:uncharacterized coiled-coil protein SlyX